MRRTRRRHPRTANPAVARRRKSAAGRDVIRSGDTTRPDHPPSRTGRAAARRKRSIDPTIPVCVLLGGVLVMLATGLAHLFSASVHGSSDLAADIGGTAVAMSLLSLAVGVRVPRRFAVWVCANAWHRVVKRGEPMPLSEIDLASAGTDRTLYWTVVSLLALVIGVLTALLPLHVALMVRAHGWMLDHFLWPIGALAVLQALTIGAAAFLPLSVLGLAVASVHHLCCRFGRWDARATAWILVGSAVGAWVGAGLAEAPSRNVLLFLVAALTALMVSVLAAMVAGPAGRKSRTSVEDISALLPVSTDRRPRLIRTAIVTAGACATCVVTEWQGGGAFVPPTGQMLGTMLLATGAGGLLGCEQRSVPIQSLRGVGFSFFLAGLSVAVGAIALRGIPDVSSSVRATCAWITLGAIGYATTKGRGALLHRVANRSSTGANVLARTLVCIALVIWIVEPLALRMIGPTFTVLIPAVMLVAIGLWLAAREPDYRNEFTS